MTTIYGVSQIPNCIERWEKIVQIAKENGQKGTPLNAIEHGIIVTAFEQCLKELEFRDKLLQEIRELVE